MPFFRDAVGQQPGIGILQSFLRTDSIPSSLLFQGEEGIGKRQVADVFVETILCQQNKEPMPAVLNHESLLEPCHLCLSCRKLNDKNHPDLSIIEPDGKSIKIDQIRQMQEQIVIKPLDGAKKIILIDPADKMNDAAANALLKTLEEPPPYATLLLVSSRAATLPTTLLSRCQKILFHPLSRSQLVNTLITKRECSLSEAQLIAALTHGNLKEALSIDIDIAREREEECYQLISESNTELFQTAEKFSKNVDIFETALSYLFTWFRDLLVIKSALSAEKVDSDNLVNPWRIETLLAWSGSMRSEEVLSFISDLQGIRQAQARNVNRRLSLESLLLSIHSKV